VHTVEPALGAIATRKRIALGKGKGANYPPPQAEKCFARIPRNVGTVFRSGQYLQMAAGERLS